MMLKMNPYWQTTWGSYQPNCFLEDKRVLIGVLPQVPPGVAIFLSCQTDALRLCNWHSLPREQEAEEKDPYGGSAFFVFTHLNQQTLHLQIFKK